MIFLFLLRPRIMILVIVKEEALLQAIHQQLPLLLHASRLMITRISSISTSGTSYFLLPCHLFRAQTILPEDKPKLYQLIDSDNPQMRQIFISFEAHRDVHKLLSDLQQILKDIQPADTEVNDSPSLAHPLPLFPCIHFLGRRNRIQISEDREEDEFVE